MNTTYKLNNNVVYSCKYHVVWCPKYRRKVLTNGVDTRLKELLTEYAANLSVEILEMEILNLVRMQPSITQKEMANALDWNLASVKYYITKLKEKNYLKRQGSSQKGKWVILTKRD